MGDKEKIEALEKSNKKLIELLYDARAGLGAPSDFIEFVGGRENCFPAGSQAAHLHSVAMSVLSRSQKTYNYLMVEMQVILDEIKSSL